MALHLLQPLLHTLHTHAHEAGLIGAGIAFVESLAVIGSFIPGSITLAAVGTLIGAGTLPAFATIIYISLGAFIGDFLSYGLGRVYQNRIHRMWPFTRYPKLLKKSQYYCQKHGGISILIGRFTGPMRSFVPMITGMMRMPTWAFVSAALPSAFAWVTVFLMPGILLGALSHEIPAKMATWFVVIGLVVIVLLWFLAWCILTFFDQISTALGDLCQVLWTILYKHHTTRYFCQLIAHPHQPGCARQLMRFLIVVINALAFVIVAWIVLTPPLLLPMDHPLYFLMQSLRSPDTQSIVVAISLLGKNVTVGIASLLIAIWLWQQRHGRYAIHLIAACLFAAASAWLLKHGFYHPRPGNLMAWHPTSSFPSGHMVMSTTIIGLMATWIRLRMKGRFAWISLTVATVIIVAIALSRLYLGMHWFSDVIGGALLGLVWMHVVLLSFWRSPPKHHPSAKQLSIATIISFVIAWGIYANMAYQKTYANTLPIASSGTIDLHAWWHGENMDSIPMIRNNRFGQADHAFNIQWIGKRANIIQVFTHNGWQSHAINHQLPTAIQRLSQQSPLPLFPKLYNNKKPDLVFTLNTTNPLIVRLWHTPIRVTGNHHHLWLGTLGSIQHRQHIFNVHPYHENQLPASQLITLEKALRHSPFRWTIKHVPKESVGAKLAWDYQIIRIRGK